MSIEGTKFCDLCGDMIHSHDVAPIKWRRTATWSSSIFTTGTIKTASFNSSSFLKSNSKPPWFRAAFLIEHLPSA